MCTLPGIYSSPYGSYYWAGGGGCVTTTSDGGIGGGGGGNGSGSLGGGYALNSGGYSLSDGGTSSGGTNTGGGGGGGCGVYGTPGTPGSGGSGIILIAVLTNPLSTPPSPPVATIPIPDLLWYKFDSSCIPGTTIVNATVTQTVVVNSAISGYTVPPTGAINNGIVVITPSNLFVTTDNNNHIGMYANSMNFSGNFSGNYFINGSQNYYAPQLNTFPDQVIGNGVTISFFYFQPKFSNHTYNAYVGLFNWIGLNGDSYFKIDVIGNKIRYNGTYTMCNGAQLALNYNEWHHIVQSIVVTKTGTFSTLYIDGQAVNGFTNMAVNYIPIFGTVQMLNNIQTSISIQDLRIYGTPYTYSGVVNLYNALTAIPPTVGSTAIALPDILWFKMDVMTLSGTVVPSNIVSGVNINNLAVSGTNIVNSASSGWNYNGTYYPANGVISGSNAICLSDTYSSSLTVSSNTAYMVITTPPITLPAAINGNGFTISFFYLQVGPCNTPNSTIFSWGGTGTGITVIGATINSINFTFDVSNQLIVNNTFTGGNTMSTGVIPSYLIWHHVAYVSTSNGGTGSNSALVTLYIDGYPVSTMTNYSDAYPPTLYSNMVALNNNSLSLNYQDIRIYGTPYSATSVLNIYNIMVQTPDILWYKMSSTTLSGTTITNSATSGAAYNSVYYPVNGSAAFIADTSGNYVGNMYLNGGLNVTGTNSNMVIASPLLPFPTNNAGNGFTISMWVFLNTSSTTFTGTLPFFSWGSSGTGSSSTSTGSNAITFTLSYAYTDSNTTRNYYLINVGSSFPGGTINQNFGGTSGNGWNHLTVVYSCVAKGGNAAVLSAYFNNSASSYYPPSHGYPINTSGLADSYPPSGSSGSVIFNAGLSMIYQDIRIYGAPLNSDAISKIYNGGQVVIGTGTTIAQRISPPSGLIATVINSNTVSLAFTSPTVVPVSYLIYTDVTVTPNAAQVYSGLSASPIIISGLTVPATKALAFVIKSNYKYNQSVNSTISNYALFVMPPTITYVSTNISGNIFITFTPPLISIGSIAYNVYYFLNGTGLPILANFTIVGNMAYVIGLKVGSVYTFKMSSTDTASNVVSQLSNPYVYVSAPNSIYITSTDAVISASGGYTLYSFLGSSGSMTLSNIVSSTPIYLSLIHIPSPRD